MAGEQIEGMRPQPLFSPGRNRAALGGPGVEGQGIKTRLGQHLVPIVVATNELIHTENFLHAVWTTALDIELSSELAPNPSKPCHVIHDYGSPGQYLQQEFTGDYEVGDTLWFRLWLKSLSGVSNVGVHLDASDLGGSHEYYVVNNFWQPYTISYVVTDTGLDYFASLEPNDGETLIYGPMVNWSTNPFSMHIESGATKGTYTKLHRVRRFIMYEDGSGNKMIEEGEADTPVMLEDI